MSARHKGWKWFGRRTGQGTTFLKAARRIRRPGLELL